MDNLDSLPETNTPLSQHELQHIRAFASIPQQSSNPTTSNSKRTMQIVFLMITLFIAMMLPITNSMLARFSDNESNILFIKIGIFAVVSFLILKLT